MISSTYSLSSLYQAPLLSWWHPHAQLFLWAPHAHARLWSTKFLISIPCNPPTELLIPIPHRLSSSSLFLSILPYIHLLILTTWTQPFTLLNSASHLHTWLFNWAHYSYTYLLNSTLYSPCPTSEWNTSSPYSIPQLSSLSSHPDTVYCRFSSSVKFHAQSIANDSSNYPVIASTMSSILLFVSDFINYPLSVLWLVA